MFEKGSAYIMNINTNKNNDRTFNEFNKLCIKIAKLTDEQFNDVVRRFRQEQNQQYD